jgi:hypothetical protein
MPVENAAVEASDGQGNIHYRVTNAAGSATINWPVTKPGEINLTVQARKEYYNSSEVLKLWLRVTECQWTLKIDFQEEYAIIKEVNMVVGATTHWTGDLKAGPPQGEESEREITLQNGNGEYAFYASDEIKAPLHVNLKDPVSGEYKLRLSGKNSGGQVSLNMGAVPVQYPPIVALELKDYSNRDIKVNYYPPVPTGRGNGLFLESNHLNDVTFPDSGGVIQLDSGMTCYLEMPDRTLYSLTITLQPAPGGQ